MIVDSISDLHGYYPKLEGGDLLIVAGDLTARDTERQHAEFAYWLEDQPYNKRIVIAGNHDNFFQKNKEWTPLLLPKAEYLCDSGTEFEGLKIWGSPWTLTFKGMNPHCKAFTVDTEEELAEKWLTCPEDVDILVTHSPPYGVLDLAGHFDFSRDKRCGSRTLSHIFERINPSLHVFGHIHESYGAIRKPLIGSKKRNMCSFVNASHVNEHYQPKNPPIRVTL